MALCPGLPGWASTRKVKPIWILLKQETVSGSRISWAICKSAPHSRQITMPAPHHSVFLQAGCPSCRPTNSVKSLKAHSTVYYDLLTDQWEHKWNLPHPFLQVSTPSLLVSWSDHDSATNDNTQHLSINHTSVVHNVSATNAVWMLLSRHITLTQPQPKLSQIF